MKLLSTLFESYPPEMQLWDTFFELYSKSNHHKTKQYSLLCLGHVLRKRRLENEDLNFDIPCTVLESFVEAIETMSQSKSLIRSRRISTQALKLSGLPKVTRPSLNELDV